MSAIIPQNLTAATPVVIPLLQQIRHDSQTVNLLVWDSRTMMPPGGAAARGRQVATLTRLARDLVSNAQLRKQHRREIGAAAAVRIPDRRREEQRAPEGLDAADVGCGRPRAHRHANQGTGKLDLRVRADQSALAQRVSRRTVAKWLQRFREGGLAV